MRHQHLHKRSPTNRHERTNQARLVDATPNASSDSTKAQAKWFHKASMQHQIFCHSFSMGQKFNIKLCRGKSVHLHNFSWRIRNATSRARAASCGRAGKEVFFSASISYSGAVTTQRWYQDQGTILPSVHLIVLAALPDFGRNAAS